MDNKENLLVIGSYIYYQKTFPINISQSIRIYFMNHYGFSHDDVPDNLSVDHIVEQVEQYRITHSLNSLTLFGHSIHAFMALAYASKYPQYVNKMVLVATPPFVGKELHAQSDVYFEESYDPVRKELYAISCDIQNTGLSPLANWMLQSGPKLWYDAAFDGSALCRDVYINPKAAHCIWGDMFDKFPISDVLQQIECPILLCLGRYDYFNPPHLWENYRHHFKTYQIKVFEKSGHTPFYEEPENFMNVMNDFLQV
jgi:proline iminopeptidase